MGQIAIQSWYWKGMYKASEDEGDQKKDGSM